jgi:hypothetical protein
MFWTLNVPKICFGGPAHFLRREKFRRCNLVQFTAIYLGNFVARFRVFKWNFGVAEPGFPTEGNRENEGCTRKRKSTHPIQFPSLASVKNSDSGIPFAAQNSF